MNVPCVEWHLFDTSIWVCEFFSNDMGVNWTHLSHRNTRLVAMFLSALNILSVCVGLSKVKSLRVCVSFSCVKCTGFVDAKRLTTSTVDSGDKLMMGLSFYYHFLDGILVLYHPHLMKYKNLKEITKSYPVNILILLIPGWFLIYRLSVFFIIFFCGTDKNLKTMIKQTRWSKNS